MTEQEWLTSEDPVVMLAHLINLRAEPTRTGDYRVSERKLRLACQAVLVACGLGPFEDDYQANLDVTAWAGHCFGKARAYSLLSRHPQVDRAGILREIVGNPFRPVKLCHCDPDVGITTCEFCHAWGQWLTPQVLSLAEAAYLERPGRKCPACGGKYRTVQGWTTAPDSQGFWTKCKACGGKGRVEDGSLDPVRLMVLADCLEEAGCPPAVECPCCQNRSKKHAGGVPNPLLTHLRSPGPHYRGCWALDLTLGKV